MEANKMLAKKLKFPGWITWNIGKRKQTLSIEQMSSLLNLNRVQRINSKQDGCRQDINPI